MLRQRLKRTKQRRPISTSPRRLKQVSNETPNDVSVVRHQDVSVVRIHDVPFSELRFRDALLVDLYNAFMFLCHGLQLVGIHV